MSKVAIMGMALLQATPVSANPAFRLVQSEPVASCNADTSCANYHCCEVDEQFTDTYGSCVEIEEFGRCRDRKKNYHIILGVIMGVIVLSVAACGYAKRVEIKRH